MNAFLPSQTVSPACKSCLRDRALSLKKLGIGARPEDRVVALSGNPNTGKSTLFNALTGLRQHTGNWPGKTVTRAEGAFEFERQRYRVIDLPGTYSLLAASPDEEIARDFILFGHPDVTVVVVDANRLERNLNLVLQVLEITDRVVVCLNLVDEARRHGLHVDPRQLSRDLGVPVISTVARRGEGLAELLAAIRDVGLGTVVCRPHHLPTESLALEPGLSQLEQAIHKAYPDLSQARWIALRLLAGDERIREALRVGELGTLGGMARPEPAPRQPPQVLAPASRVQL